MPLKGLDISMFMWYNMYGGLEMDKYHVHIYIIQALAEVEVDACDSIEAKEKALAMDLDYHKPDCNKIAIAFLEKSGE